MKLTYVYPSGREITVEVPAGMSVMQATVNNGIEGIVAECGGSCMCATCHVYVHEDWLPKLPAPGPAEKEMLASTAAERRANSRLGCQIEMTTDLDGLVVHLPDKQV